MDLSTLTPSQRLCVETADRPLFVSAGAGSGKTHTLTARIVYSLLPQSGPVVDGMDRICAITFTEAAAQEIKSRVKSTLRQEGCFEAALQADDAWISTIHGMCTRILRRHALELGLDPAFKILDGQLVDSLRSKAIDEVLGKADEDGILVNRYQAVFDEYPQSSGSNGGGGAVGIVTSLMDAARSQVDGFQALYTGPESRSPQLIAQDLLELHRDALAWLGNNSSKTAEKARDFAEGMVESLIEYQLRDFENETLLQRYIALAKILPKATAMPVVTARGLKEPSYRHRAAYLLLVAEVQESIGYVFLVQMMDLAAQVEERFDQLKRDEGGLAIGDLIRLTLRAFRDYPDIAAVYKDKFQMVMVDEFQDTNQMQVELIRAISGENCCRLATVGDAQQAIYRFQQADVQVYRAHREWMSRPEVGARIVELDKNFRSHEDVLHLVDRVFEQPRTFGDEFMSLVPDLNRKDTYCGGLPRINVISVKGNASDAVSELADRIAQHFAALRDEGAKPGDMAVLLGKMTNAAVFADALRSYGLECAVTKGSGFATASETIVVMRLMELLTNRGATAALFEVLASDLFCIGAEDLLRLGSKTNEKGSLMRCRLDQGLVSLLSGEISLASPRLKWAAQILDKAWDMEKSHRTGQVLRYVVAASGWLDRLEAQGAQGRATAANVMKSLRIVDDIEAMGKRGFASVSSYFTSFIESVPSEQPGSLAGTGQDFVRIMTIHASKGLEFPIVAVAEAERGRPPSPPKLLIEMVDGLACLSLTAGKSFKAATQAAASLSDYRAVLSKLGKDDSELPKALDASTLGEYRLALAKYEDAEDAAEFQRKLYVGLTRAVEALVVGIKEPSNKKSYAGITADIANALGIEEDIAPQVTKVDIGGTEPAWFTQVEVGPAESDETEELAVARADGLTAEDALGVSDIEGCEVSEEGFEAEGKELRVFAQPELLSVPRMELESAGSLREGIFSYTSLGHGAAEDSFNVAYDLDGYRVCDDDDLPAILACKGFVPAAQEAAPLGRDDDDMGTLADSGNRSGDGLLASRSLEQAGYDYEGVAGSQGLPLASDADGSASEASATLFGTAFHRLAQYRVVIGDRPDEKAIAHQRILSGLDDANTARLRCALDRWFGSEVYKCTQEYAVRRAEVPFMYQVAGGYLEGEIDLLCTNGPEGDGKALIVDYKTGGRRDETPEDLRAKHLLQVQCYAYAALTTGFTSVELVFVRVEQEDQHRPGQPQTVAYRFDATQREELTLAIAQRRGE